MAYASAVLRGRLSRTVLLDAAQVPAAANTDRAAFDTNRPGADIEKIALIGIAIFDVVEGAGPLSRTTGLKRWKHRHANERPISQRRIGIVFVGPWAAGFR